MTSQLLQSEVCFIMHIWVKEEMKLNKLDHTDEWQEEADVWWFCSQNTLLKTSKLNPNNLI